MHSTLKSDQLPFVICCVKLYPAVCLLVRQTVYVPHRDLETIFTAKGQPVDRAESVFLMSFYLLLTTQGKV